MDWPFFVKARCPQKLCRNGTRKSSLSSLFLLQQMSLCGHSSFSLSLYLFLPPPLPVTFLPRSFLSHATHIFVLRGLRRAISCFRKKWHKTSRPFNMPRIFPLMIELKGFLAVADCLFDMDSLPSSFSLFDFIKYIQVVFVIIQHWIRFTHRIITLIALFFAFTIFFLIIRQTIHGTLHLSTTRLSVFFLIALSRFVLAELIQP